MELFKDEKLHERDPNRFDSAHLMMERREGGLAVHSRKQADHVAECADYGSADSSYRKAEVYYFCSTTSVRIPQSTRSPNCPGRSPAKDTESDCLANRCRLVFS